MNDKTKRAHLSDHAIYRYAERVAGFDIEAARRYIRSKIGSRLDAAAAMGAKSVTIDGLTYVFKGQTVTTVLENSTTTVRGNHIQREELSK